jgi:hypothetical protein
MVGGIFNRFIWIKRNNVVLPMPLGPINPYCTEQTEGDSTKNNKHGELRATSNLAHGHHHPHNNGNGKKNNNVEENNKENANKHVGCN